ncbi:sensor histidine kinase [Clostridium akagii]|uniref:sensor histidine kinase n=1 Tax=Clostridium akagii TaxID=91623 RepID=UPI00047C0FDC|nr:sensor histidine kinase [Clostridium akagii]
MWNKTLLTAIRYYLLLMIIIGIIINGKSITTAMIICIFIYIINNQLRFFSLDKNYEKIISFIVEIIYIFIAYNWLGGYISAYLILAAIDSNILFENPWKSVFNVAIILEAIYFSANKSLEFKFINIGIVIVIIAILYFVVDENHRKLRAQDLYDKLRISEEKLKKANRDLELYASSIEEITLLRERNRISREIHDSVGHALSTIAIQLGAIERTVEKNSHVSKQLTKDLRKFVQESLNEVRKAVREIKPKDFEKYQGIFMIEELINNFQKMAGIDVRLSFTKEKWSLNSDQAFVIYRVIQEFLVNSVRHGKATSVQIMMIFKDEKLSVSLRDNGIGAGTIIEGIGLKSMRQRVNELGGTFLYSTKLQDGFLVKIDLDKKEKLKIYSWGDSNEEN